jgi:hypothetical protein
VLDGGIGSNMPANTTFGSTPTRFRLRYHPNRNFDKLFEGDGQMPIDKDAIAQFIGWMGELTMTNPLFNWRLYDSNPAAYRPQVTRPPDVQTLSLLPRRRLRPFSLKRRTSMAYRDPDDAWCDVQAPRRQERSKSLARLAARSSTTSKSCEIRNPARATDGVSGHFDLALGDRPAEGEQSSQTYAERFSRQYQQFKAQRRADQVRHAARRTRRSSPRAAAPSCARRTSTPSSSSPRSTARS